MNGAELLQALAIEVNTLGAELNECYERILAEQEDTVGSGLENYLAGIGRLAEAAELMNLASAQRICASLRDSAKHLPQLDHELRLLAQPYFIGWPALFEQHLLEPENIQHIDALIEHFSIGILPGAMSEGALALLHTELLDSAHIGSTFAQQDRTTFEPLSAEDLDLNVSVDVDPALVDAFLHDAPIHANELTEALSAWQQAPQTVEHLLNAKRAAHTLKGSANIIGLRGVAKLSHRLEDFLELCEGTADILPPARATALMAAADCLAQWVAAVAGEDVPPDNALAIVAQLDAVFDQADLSVHTAPPSAETINAIPDNTVHIAEEQVTAQPAPVSTKPVTQPDIHMTRVATPLLDDLVRVTGEITIKLGEIEQDLKLTTQQSQQRLEQDRAVQRRIYELEKSVQSQALIARRAERAMTHETHKEFDALELDQYSEVQSITHALLEETTDSRELGSIVHDKLLGFVGLLHQQRHLLSELQRLSTQTRMAPFASLVPRLQRNVRQTAAATHKRAELVVLGADTMIEFDMLDQLLDPLLHIVRNAVDHGLELPDERTLLGKKPQGTVTFNIQRRGHMITIECSDDGRGLDLPAIRSKAQDRGLIEPTATLNDADIARLILLPGFSTRDTVTEISGRGIGMDVVATRLRALQGSVDIRSQLGVSTTIELRLPVSLAATHTLFVYAAKQLFGIPSHTVLRAIPASTAEITRTGTHFTVRIGTLNYPATLLTRLVGMEDTEHTQGTTPQHTIVLCDTEMGPHGILVEQVRDVSPLVTKSLGRYLRQSTGLLGAGLLGDGTIVPLLDISELLRTPVSAAVQVNRTRLATTQAPRKRILVVDDSLSVRRALSALLADAGYEVLQARDGMEAINVLETVLPDLLLTDLEMPNMNGLALTTHIRAQPTLLELPIVMLTSRSMEKHRRQAQAVGVDKYLTKPFTNVALLQEINAALHHDSAPSAAMS